MVEDLKIEAYCMKCRQSRDMAAVTAVFTAQGKPAVQGVCSVCGTRMFRMGRTALHEGLTPPTVETPPPTVETPPPTVETPPPTGKLVIVESPTKARTVGRFLGKGYIVKASVGHVRDLLRSQLSVDVEHDFAPKYRIPNEKRTVVKELQAAVSKAGEIYLATDPDREGEAIAWHLSEVLELPEAHTHRVVFHEITEPAVAEAFAHPRDLDMDLVNAQQARRVLDRLVGYNLSPLLWRKVRSRLSAGRVQSVALRLVVEREREIKVFVPEEYWTLDAELTPQSTRGKKQRKTFRARLVRVRGEEPQLHTEADIQPLLEALESAEYEVVRLKEGQRRRNPAAPFTTSTMQQEASRRLNFTAAKTMRIAQQLYEGLDIGDGQPVGLITYMRTDSTTVAATAQAEAREYINGRYGAQFMPVEPPQYKTRAKGAQEAHEAIRPTSVLRTPDALKGQLSSDQYRLYDLIWRRFVASQMAAAVYDTRTVEIGAGRGADKPFLFRASGSTLNFPGFLVVYEELQDENGNGKDKEELQPVPPLQIGELLDLIRLWPEQHFTQPPPRYTDATLIRALEEYGIGRPSTYAAILSNIQERGYVTREQRRLYPTETGVLVNDLLVSHFPDLISVDFTAAMEERLDAVAEGQLDWVELLRDFYGPFERTLQQADMAIEKVEAVEPVGRNCPECGAPLIIRWGRYGKFIGCSAFPACRYTEPWLEKIGVTCPQCHVGDVVLKHTKKGRIFYGCSTWPKCDFMSWKRPLAQPCPVCGGLLLEVRKDAAQCQQCQAVTPLETVETPEPAAV